MVFLNKPQIQRQMWTVTAYETGITRHIGGDHEILLILLKGALPFLESVVFNCSSLGVQWVKWQVADQEVMEFYKWNRESQ
jgi:hypoxanthine-guanine phosphoribosyltransferase